MDDTGRSRRTGAFAAALAALAIALAAGLDARAQTTSGNAGTGAALFASKGCTVAGCHTSLAALPAIQNGANSGGHVIYATGNGMTAATLTAGEAADIAAHIATAISQPSPTNVAVPFQTATGGIAIPYIYLNSTYGDYTALQFVSASKGSASFSGTTATYTPNACQTGGDTVTFKAIGPPMPGQSSDRTFTVNIANPTTGPTISSANSASGQTLVPFTYNSAASTCPGIVTWSMPSAPAWLSMNGSGQVTGTPPAGTQGTSPTFTIRGTYPGGQFTNRVVTLNITLGPPGITGANVPGVNGAAFSYQVIATNSPTSYTVTSGALPPGLNLAPATGLITGTPTAGGAFNNVQITVSNGVLPNASALFNFNIATVAPVVSPGAVSGQTGTPITPYQIVAINAPDPGSYTASPLPPGLALDATTGIISGTPTAVGVTNTIVSASNGAGPGNNATVTFTITLGPPVITSGGTAGGSTAASFSYQIAATNNPTSYGATGLPPGLTVNPATGLIQGVPSATGTFNAVVSATNATATATLPLVITIADGTPVITSASTATGAYGQPFAFKISTNPRATTYEVTGLPPGLTMNPINGFISGTPTSGGTYAVNVTATNMAGSGSGVLTIRIDFVAPGAQDLSVEVPFEVATPINLPVSGQFTQVTILTLPSHGLLTTPAPGTATVTYTPATGYSGTDSFRYSVTGPGGTTEGTVTLTVGTAAPQSGTARLATSLNTPASLDLRPFITGSGVTGIAIASLPGHGTVAVSGTSVTYTPRQDFFGTDSFTYTAFGNVGTSAPALVEVTVDGRPDPSQDRTVVGIVESQAQAARRFSRAQIGNFQRRLESLHAGPPAGPATAGTTAAPPKAASAPPPAPASTDPFVPAPQRSGFVPVSLTAGDSPKAAPASPFVSKLAGTLVGAVTAKNVDLGAVSGAAAPATLQGGTQVWMGGLAHFGKIGGGDEGVDQRFSTDGLSLGADRRVSDRLVIGLGLGYGRDRTDIGDDGSRSKASGMSFAGYGSYQPSRNTFVDALLGFGRLDLDTERFVPSRDAYASAAREGTQFFGSVAAGYELRREGLLVSPYGRLDVTVDRLDQATETGAGPAALSYHEQTLRSTQAAAGIRVETRHETDFGWTVPRARLEYRREFEGGQTANISYADLVGGLTYSVTPAGTGRNSLVFGVGADFLWRKGLRIGIDYQGERTSNPGTAQAIRFLVSQDLDGRLPAWPASWSWQPFTDPVNVDAGFAFDDNVSRGRLDGEKLSDQVYSLGINTGRIFPINPNLRAQATALLSVDKFHEQTGLGRTSGGVQGELQYRASGDFDAVTYALFARGWIDAYESKLRSGSRVSAGANARRSLTDRVDAFGEVGVNWRRAESDVFEGREYAARFNFDYSLGTAGTAYLTGEWRRGDTFASGFASLWNLNLADVFVRDDALEGGEFFSYRFEATTLLGTLGYNRPLGPRDSIDFSYRRIRTTPLDTPGSGPSSYSVNQYSILYLMRF